jgi:hypothetical protein
MPRHDGWRPARQVSAAQGHLRKQGVAGGDIFLFWGLFRRVDERDGWIGRPEHYVWGWMQIGCIAPVDSVVREGGASWSWARNHPHLRLDADPTNTLYVATDRLKLPGLTGSLPGGGTLDEARADRRLTCASAASPSEWCLPDAFRPRAHTRPLTYHSRADRWSQAHGRTHLRVVSRGQEFVLDLDLYPGVVDWVAQLLQGS